MIDTYICQSPGKKVFIRVRWAAASSGRFTTWSAGRVGSPMPASMSSTGGSESTQYSYRHV